MGRQVREGGARGSSGLGLFMFWQGPGLVLCSWGHAAPYQPACLAAPACQWAGPLLRTSTAARCQREHIWYWSDSGQAQRGRSYVGRKPYLIEGSFGAGPLFGLCSLAFGSCSR
jgi:hypothetical protein